jgi:hypothetical protein
MGAQLFHADGRTDGHTDMTELIVALRNFANAPKKYVQFICICTKVSHYKYFITGNVSSEV